MKESKTYKSTARGKSINKSSSRPKNSSNDTVRIRQVSPVDKDFEGVQEEDNKRLVVFIAIGVLVIVGTIIGLLIGLNNKKEEEPKKPEDEIVIPTVPEEDKKEEEEYRREKPLPVVRKVTKKTSSKTTSSEESNKEESDKHSITYYNGENSEKVDIEEGTKLVDHEFKGYTDCSFYYDENHEEIVEDDATAVEDMNVYAVCTLINYTINYDTESSNITTYNVEMEDYTLENPTSNNGLNFGGWYLESTFETRVTKLTKSIVDNADENNIINLYAKFTSAIQIDYYDDNGEVKHSDEHDPVDLYTLISGEEYCSVGEFSGWATSSDGEAEYEEGAQISVEVPMQYYAVCKNVSSLSLGNSMQTMTLVGEAADLDEDKELLLEEEKEKTLEELDLDTEEENKEELEQEQEKETETEIEEKEEELTEGSKEELTEGSKEEITGEVLEEENKEDESKEELITDEEEEKEELTEEKDNEETDNNPEEDNKEVDTSKNEEESEEIVKKEEVIKTDEIKEEEKVEVSKKKEEETVVSKKEEVEDKTTEEEETEEEKLIQE